MSLTKFLYLHSFAHTIDISGVNVKICKVDLEIGSRFRNRFRNRYPRTPDEINRKLCKQQLNKCVFIRRKSIKHYFPSITSNGIITNENFWKAIKPFLTNKGCLENSDIMLRDDEKVITDEKKLVQLFNDHYFNIVERSSGFKPEKVEFDIGSGNKNGVLNSILDNTKITLVLQKSIKTEIYNPLPFLYLLPVGVLR